MMDGKMMKGRTGAPMPSLGMGQGLPAPAAAMMQRSMTPMAAQQIMPMGRAYAKGGMVGCDWKPKSSSTMSGAARKGK
jgi:hypothetical protein